MENQVFHTMAGATLIIVCSLFFGWLTVVRLRNQKRFNDRLFESGQRYRLMLEGARNYAHFFVDEKGRITEWNDRASMVLGFTGAEALGKSMTKLFPHDDLTKDSLTTLLGAATHHRGVDTRITAFRDSNYPQLVDLRISPVHDMAEHVTGFSVVAQRVDPLRHKHLEAVANEEQLRGILDTAMDAIITVDGQYKIVIFNKTAELIFGLSALAVIGRSLDMLLPERFRRQHHHHVEDFSSEGITARKMGVNSVLHGLRGNGEEFPIEASISRTTDGSNVLMTVILRDITIRQKAQNELHKAREELQQLAIASQTALEAEKSRLSRELHDELGQGLTAIKMDVAWLAANAPKDNVKFANRTQAVQSLLDSVVAATRRIASDLRPLMLDDLGLVDALQWLASDFRRRYGVDCKLSIEPNHLRLSPQIESGIFRMVQECLTNIAKHAQATHVRIELKHRESVLSLTIEDDGIGILDSDLKKQGSFGLLGLKERVYAFTGTLEISGNSGRGSVIKIAIPYDPHIDGMTL
jgi:PAS domain S-box-containing protein